MQWEKAKGKRLHQRFFGVSVQESKKCWWCCGEWMTIEDANATGELYSNFCQVRSLKAFRRHLRKHGHKGVCYTLTSMYVGYDVSAYGRNPIR